jgi:hypothetical protein
MNVRARGLSEPTALQEINYCRRYIVNGYRMDLIHLGATDEISISTLDCVSDGADLCEHGVRD